MQTELDKEILRESRLGQKLKQFRAEGSIPNSLVLKVIEGILCSREASLHGWVVHNFPPENGEKLIAELANSASTPNRVVRFALGRV